MRRGCSPVQVGVPAPAPVELMNVLVSSHLGLVSLKTKKFSRFSVTSNLVAHALNIKYRRKQKLITQFSCKSRDESFNPS